METLRGVGLSRQKGSYIQNVAAFFSETPSYLGILASNRRRRNPIERLTSIKGVGKWTTQMIMMFSLDRPDIFPDR